MATATAPAAASTTSGGRPASVSTQTPAPASGNSSPAGQTDYGAELARGLGIIPRDRAPEPVGPSNGQSAVPTSDPSTDGHPDSVAATETELPAAQGEAAEQSQQEVDENGNPIERVALPGDDLLKELAELELPKEVSGEGQEGESPLTASEGPLTAEQIEKIANPDGKATLEQRYKNLQSVIGRQGQSYGKVKAQLQQIQQGMQQFASLVGFDAASGKMTPTPQGLLKLVEMSGMNDQQWNEVLAERGVKIVPLDTVDPNADLKAVLDEMLPGNELTFEEKQLEAEGWTGAKKREFDSKIRKREIDREIARREQEAAKRLQEAQSQEQTKQQAQRMSQVVDSFLGQIEKRSDGKELLPAIKYWNRQLPKNMDIEARCKVLFSLAQATRIPSLLKKLRDDTLKFAAEQQGRNYLASAAVPIGEVPTVVNSRNGKQGISQQERKAMADVLLGSR